MKLFLAIALIAVVAAEPEADSHHLGFSPYQQQFAGFNPHFQPYSAFHGVRTPFTYGSQYGLRTMGKREAESDAQFNPFYNTHAVNSFYQPTVAHVAQKYYQPTVAQQTVYQPAASVYSGMYKPTVNSYLASPYRFKREADSDAQYTGFYNTNAFASQYYHPTVAHVAQKYYQPTVAQQTVYQPAMYPAQYQPAFASAFYRNKRDADAQYNFPGVYSTGHYATAGQLNTVYKNGDFHTNVANLQKGIHTQKVAQSPVSQFYNAVSPTQQFAHTQYVNQQYAMPAMYQQY